MEEHLRTGRLSAHSSLRPIIPRFINTFLLEITGEKFFHIDSGRFLPLHSQPSQHFTIVLNAFVLMTLFNAFNTKKINGDRNIVAVRRLGKEFLQDILANHLFNGIWVGTLLMHVLVIQFGGLWFSTASLTLKQWLWCFAIGLGPLLWGQVSRLVPSKSCYRFSVPSTRNRIRCGHNSLSKQIVIHFPS